MTHQPGVHACVYKSILFNPISVRDAARLDKPSAAVCKMEKRDLAETARMAHNSVRPGEAPIDEQRLIGQHRLSRHPNKWRTGCAGTDRDWRVSYNGEAPEHLLCRSVVGDEIDEHEHRFPGLDIAVHHPTSAVDSLEPKYLPASGAAQGHVPVNACMHTKSRRRIACDAKQERERESGRG